MLDCCETGVLKSIGEIGFAKVADKKWLSLGFSCCFSIVSIVLLFLSYSGASLNEDTVQKYAWTIEKSINNDLYSEVNIAYFGLREVYFPALDPSDTDDNNHVVAYSVKYSDCSILDDATDFGCSDCYKAGKLVAVAVACGVVFNILIIVANIGRIWRDRACLKITSLLCGVCNIGVLAAGLCVWKAQCFNNISKFDNGYLADGSGLMYFSLGFAGNAVAILYNVIVPTYSVGKQDDANAQQQPLLETDDNEKRAHRNAGSGL